MDTSKKRQFEQIFLLFASIASVAIVKEDNMTTVRAIDESGRISLPDNIREVLGVFEGDQFDIITEGFNIVLVRHTQACLACGDDTEVQRMNKTYLCGECRDAITKTL